MAVALAGAEHRRGEAGMVWNAKSSILGADTEAELDQIETQFDFARKFYAGIEA